MQTSKIRHQFYLPAPLSKRLDELAARPGASKTAILTDALTAWFERRGANELDERFGPRLDRQQRIAQRIDRTVATMAELLDLFVAHQMMLSAHQPPFDEETVRLGGRRYRQLMDQVARRLAAGQPGGALWSCQRGDDQDADSQAPIFGC